MMTQRITGSLTIAFALLSLAACLAYARRLGVVSPEMAVRASMAASGLMVAFYGNAIPKIVRTTSPCMRSVQRFAGWAFVLSGLAYAAIWALAPMDMAGDAAMTTVGGAMVAVFAYGLWMRTRAART